MVKCLRNVITAAIICGFFMGLTPDEARAADCIGVETSSSYKVKIDAPSAKLYAAENPNSVVLGKAIQGKTYDVISYDRGWVRVAAGDTEGYLKVAGQATVVETTREKVDEEAVLRTQVVEYALQFLGNRYVWGGVNPNTGVDCSGFTSYVMRHAAGVSLSHSSTAQSGEGRTISIKDARPGDLIFYGNDSRINHVAIYMGDGQIVHASTEKTGIKTSRWNYRTPVKAVDVLSQ